MRRITLLAIAFLLALFAASLLAPGDGMGEALPGWRLRDALLPAVAAIALAAWGAAAYPRNWNLTTWSSMGRAVIGAGLVTALAGLLLRALGMPNAHLVWSAGVAIALLGMALPAVVTRFSSPAFRWQRGEGGAFVRQPTTTDGEPVQVSNSGWGWRVAILLMVALGIAVRIWQVSALPPLCRIAEGNAECQTLLLLQGEANARAGLASALLIPLARGLALVPTALDTALVVPLAEPLWALRWAIALVSLLALPVLWRALHALTGRAGVLLGVTLFALHPLFVQSASAGSLHVESQLWLLLAIGAGASALRNQNPRAWALAGMALGLLAVSQPQWTLAWLVILLLCALLVIWQRGATWLSSLVVLVAGALAGGAFSGAFSGASSAQVLAPLQGAARSPEILQSLGAQLSLLPAGSQWLLGLTLVGVGVALRLRHVGALLLVSLLASVAVALRVESGAPGALLTLLVFPALLAPMALDQFVRALQRTWLPLLRPAAWSAAALVLVAGLAGWSLLDGARAVEPVRLAADDRSALAALDFLMAAREDASLAQSTFLLTPPLLAHPSIRMGATQELEAGRLLPFTAISDLPFTGERAGGIVFLASTADVQTQETLRWVYPEGRTLPLADADGAANLFVFRVDPALLFDSTGLAQFVYSGEDFGSADEAQLSRGVGPLAFAWGEAPPAEPPFSVEWSGSLLLPRAGDYTFAVQAPAAAIFSMTLDGRLVLDTSLGLLERSEQLPAGAQRVELRYRSGASASDADESGDLTVLWTPPDGATEPIPRDALYNPALANIGLLGAYTAGSAWDGAVLALRKDFQIIADATLEPPWGVVWQGHLAAPRAGEYLIGAVTNGALLVDVEGRRLLSHLPDGSAQVTVPTEATIYLEQGWAPVTIRFATSPQAAPEMRLYWQPPGGAPEPLRATYFTPEAGDAAVLRPLPALAAGDARLGDADFSLSADSILWNPTVRIPPTNLAPLLFENTATYGACGVGDGQFNAPHGIAWDGAQNVLYVADTGNARVVALGAQDGAMQTLPIAGLEEPVDVALTPTGDLLILDTLAPRIVRYAPASEETTVIALGEGFYRPRALAVDGAGMIHIADTGGARVAVIDESGALVAQFGGQGTPLGRGQPAAVAATGRAIWALAAEDGRLWQLNTLGGVSAIQRTDTINGPHIAAVDGRLFISDPARRQVIYFSEAGQPLGALADAGAFDLPTGVAARMQGDDLLLAVVDSTRCSVSLWQGRVDLLPN